MACRRFDWCVLLLLALSLLILPLRWLLAVLLAGAVHELGHYVALRLCGVNVSNLRIGIGGARMTVGDMGRWQELLCALAGPMAGLSLILLARWLPRTAVCACIHSAYNLLPVYPLDGGRAVHCICASERVCRWIEWSCIGLIAFTGLYGSLFLKLGYLPIVVSAMTIHRALAGKGSCKAWSFSLQ